MLRGAIADSSPSNLADLCSKPVCFESQTGVVGPSVDLCLAQSVTGTTRRLVGQCTDLSLLPESVRYSEAMN